MDWTARHPEMNFIDNCWGILSRVVYDGGRQFDTMEDLWEVLTYEWEN